MNRIRPLAIVLSLAFSICCGLPAQDVVLTPASGQPDGAASVAAPNSESTAILKRIQDKVAAKQNTPAGLAPELAEFDALLARFQGEKSEAAAEIAFARATVFLFALRDEPAALKHLAGVRDAYPNTKSGEAAARWVDRLSPEGKNRMAAQLAANKARLGKLIGQPAPEIDFTWSTRAGLKKISDLRGSVVVLDFWATWCGPCIASFPKVRQEVEHFQGSPVIVLGVTSLQGRVNNLTAKQIDVKGDPEREYALTADFMKKHQMTWDVAFSTQKVYNPDYLADNGIPSIAIIAPDGTVRHAAINPHLPGADVAAKITAILKEFNLPVPAAAP